MLSKTNTLFLDGLIASGYGFMFMFFSEFMTNFHLKIPHTSGMNLFSELYGVILFGLGIGISWMIDSKNKKMKQIMIDMRALMWGLTNVFLLSNKDIFDEDMYIVTLGLSLFMTLLTMVNTTPFRDVEFKRKIDKRPLLKRSMTPEPQVYHRFGKRVKRKIKEC